MIVLKIGGSVLFPDGPDINNIKKLKKLVNSLGEKVAIVVGGGKFNSIYAEKLRELGVSEAFGDLVGIDFSHLNAKIIAQVIGGTYIENFEQVDEVKLPVMGGQTPGQSTDAVAAVLAELTRSKLVLVKDVGGIYTDNPKKNPKAKLIERMNFKELIEFASKEEFGAKAYGVMDLQACRIVARSKISTFVCGVDTIKESLQGKAGTIIKE
jgi:uridylate kinase